MGKTLHFQVWEPIQNKISALEDVLSSTPTILGLLFLCPLLLYDSRGVASVCLSVSPSFCLGLCLLLNPSLHPYSFLLPDTFLIFFHPPPTLCLPLLILK